MNKDKEWAYSPSQINNYLICPYNYYLTYKIGYREIKTGKLYFGTVIHKGFSKLLRGSDINEVTEETFARIQSPEEEIMWETDKGKFVDRADKIYSAFVQNFVHLKPDLIEEKVEKEVNRFNLVGILDAYFNSGTLIDWKVVSRFGDKSPLQMVFYSLLKPAALGKYIMFNPYGKFKGQEVLIKREKMFYEKQIFETIGLIEAGIFPKTAPPWKCSEKYCQFYDHCHKGKDITLSIIK